MNDQGQPSRMPEFVRTLEWPEHRQEPPRHRSTPSPDSASFAASVVLPRSVIAVLKDSTAFRKCSSSAVQARHT